MNSISDDEIISILRYLPPKECAKFARVSHKFNDLITSNTVIFPKPQRVLLSLTVGQKKECRFVRNSGMLTIHKDVISFAVTILQSGHVRLLQVNDLGKQTLNDFYNSGVLRRAKEEKPFCEVDIFLMWLCSQADFDVMEFIELGQLAQKVRAAIGPSRTRIYCIALREPFGNTVRQRRDSFSVYNISRFFKSIRDGQEEFEVKLRLEVVPLDVNSYVRVSSHITLLNDYTSIFPEVQIIQDRTRLFAGLCALGEKWIERTLKPTKFTMIFSYVNEHPRPSPQPDYYCQRFLGFSFSLLDMSAETFATLADYDSVDKFPEFLDCQKKIDKVKFMRLYFRQINRNICVTAEVIKHS